MRAFSMYEPYSRAAPERLMLAFARVIPITPNAQIIVRIVAVISSSMVENPLRVRSVSQLALLLYIALLYVGVIVPKVVVQVENDHEWAVEQSWCQKSSLDKIPHCD